MSQAVIHYQASVKANERNSSYIQIAELLTRHGPARQRILEVGCSSGYLGGYLRSLSHWVTGVEPAAAAAEAARAVLDDVHAGDFESYLANHGSREPFDTIVFGDVLEHLADPVRALRDGRALLSSAGSFAISIPNITHGGVRAMLLEGRWKYQDLGILDRTHMRFFSRDGLIEMLDAAGCTIVEMRRTTMPIDVMSRQFDFKLRRSSVAVVQSMARDADIDTFQFIVLARPSDDSTQTAEHNARWHWLPIESGERVERRPWRALRRRARARLRALGALLGLSR